MTNGPSLFACSRHFFGVGILRLSVCHTVSPSCSPGAACLAPIGTGRTFSIFQSRPAAPHRRTRPSRSWSFPGSTSHRATPETCFIFPHHLLVGRPFATDWSSHSRLLPRHLAGGHASSSNSVSFTSPIQTSLPCGNILHLHFRTTRLMSSMVLLAYSPPRLSHHLCDRRCQCRILHRTIAFGWNLPSSLCSGGCEGFLKSHFTPSPAAYFHGRSFT